jgi:hypothetical protein
MTVAVHEQRASREGAPAAGVLFTYTVVNPPGAGSAALIAPFFELSKAPA